MKKPGKFLRKSQMEILGLAIVVALILVVMTFVISVMFREKTLGARPGFVSAQLSNNLVYTFLDTASRDCSYLTMTELLQDCAQGNTIICDNGMDSCVYVDATAKELFNMTLEKWRQNYLFEAYIDSSNPLVRIGKACKSKTSKPYQIPTNTEPIMVKLDICT